LVDFKTSTSCPMCILADFAATLQVLASVAELLGQGASVYESSVYASVSPVSDTFSALLMESRLVSAGIAALAGGGPWNEVYSTTHVAETVPASHVLPLLLLAPLVVVVVVLLLLPPPSPLPLPLLLLLWATIRNWPGAGARSTGLIMYHRLAEAFSVTIRFMVINGKCRDIREACYWPHAHARWL
jgi:hypothetical protein